MAVTMDEIYEFLKELKADIVTQLSQRKILPTQVSITSGLSEISEKLGLIQAGEFRVGNGVDPSRGFSGVRMGYPPFTYNSELWHLVGVLNDVLQFGLSADNGKAYFGGGVNILDQYGIHVYDAGSKPALIALSAAETVNSESLGAGDVLIGDNSSGKPNILWDNSAATLYFRLGTIAYNQMSTGSFQSNSALAARTATQSIGNGTVTNIQFDLESIDDNGFINLGTDNTKITIPANFGGTYTVAFNYAFASNATGFRTGALKKNGTAIAGDTRNAVNGTATAGYASTIVTLAAADYLQVEVAQTSGGSLNIEGATLWIKKER